MLNLFTPKSDLIDFTLSNARRFYSSKGYPLGVKGLKKTISLNHFTPKSDLIDFTLSNARRFYSSKGDPLGVKGLKGPSQPHLCFCLHARNWPLYYIRSLSKRTKITVKLLKIIKHTFRNKAYSKTIRICFTMLYQ